MLISLSKRIGLVFFPIHFVRSAWNTPKKKHLNIHSIFIEENERGEEGWRGMGNSFTMNTNESYLILMNVKRNHMAFN